MARSEMVQSVFRAIDILEAVAGADRGLTTLQLSDELGWKHSTTANLVRTLESRGYLVRKTTRAPLQLGPAVGQLLVMQNQNTFMLRAADALRQLAQQWTDVSFGIAQRMGHQVCGVLNTSGTQLNRLHDYMMNPYNSLHAMVHLAFGPETFLRQTYQRYQFIDYAAPLWKQPQEMEAWLRQQAQTGYLLLPRDSMNRLRIACPIYDRQRSVIASLGASTYEQFDQATLQRLIDDMLRQASQIAMQPEQV